MNPANRKFIANPDILCEKEPDGMLLFDPQSGEVKILNETGAFVFEDLANGNDFAGILQHLLLTFDDCDASVVESDLAEILRQLEQSGLICEIRGALS